MVMWCHVVSWSDIVRYQLWLQEEMSVCGSRLLGRYTGGRRTELWERREIWRELFIMYWSVSKAPGFQSSRRWHDVSERLLVRGGRGEECWVESGEWRILRWWLDWWWYTVTMSVMQRQPYWPWLGLDTGHVRDQQPGQVRAGGRAWGLQRQVPDHEELQGSGQRYQDLTDWKYFKPHQGQQFNYNHQPASISWDELLFLLETKQSTDWARN